MTRGLTTAASNAAANAQVAAEYIVELNFSSGYVRVWSGIGTLSWNSLSWTGVGELGSIGVIQEQEGVVATGVTLTLDVTDSSLLSTALTEDYQGRSATIWLSFFDPSTLAIVDDPVNIFAGIMDNMVVADRGSEGSITINAESYLRRLDHAEEQRRTDVNKQERFSGDLGL